MADGDGVYLSQSPEAPKKVELFAESSSNKIVEEKKIMNENEGMMIEETLEKKEEEVKKEGIEEEEEKIELDDQSDLSYEENETNVRNMEEEKFEFLGFFMNLFFQKKKNLEKNSSLSYRKEAKMNWSLRMKWIIPLTFCAKIDLKNIRG